jgi:TonB family protein
VPVPSPPRVYEECDDNPYRLLNSSDMDRGRIEGSPDGRALVLVVIQCDEDRERDFDREPDLSAGPVFTPMTVRPEIRNRREVQAALMREYPPTLRDAGIGGTVVVWFLISEEGTVLERRVSEGSGQTQLDEAALRVADVFTFSPAMNRDRIVPVWILLPITFQVR